MADDPTPVPASSNQEPPEPARPAIFSGMSVPSFEKVWNLARLAILVEQGIRTRNSDSSPQPQGPIILPDAAVTPILTESYVRKRIRDTRRQLGLWFAGSLALTIGLAWIAAASYGPAADVVYLLGGFAGLGALIFGIGFFSSFSAGRAALRDLPHYQNNPEAFERVHGSAMRI